jgi:hypothetical protein
VPEATPPLITRHPTADQIDEAMHRAAAVARTRTRYPDRIAEFPRGVDDCEEAEAGWWHIGWLVVAGAPTKAG